MKVTVTEGKKKTKSKFKAGDRVTLKWPFIVSTLSYPSGQPRPDGKIFVFKEGNVAMQFLVDESEVKAV